MAQAVLKRFLLSTGNVGSKKMINGPLHGLVNREKPTIMSERTVQVQPVANGNSGESDRQD